MTNKDTQSIEPTHLEEHPKKHKSGSNMDAIKDFDATLLIEESEVDLIKILAKLPIVIDEACEGFKPHSIAAYLFEVASSFNQFYRDCPVLPEENKNLRIARLSLVNSTKIVIRNGLDLLGIVVPEEM